MTGMQGEGAIACGASTSHRADGLKKANATIVEDGSGRSHDPHAFATHPPMLSGGIPIHRHIAMMFLPGHRIGLALMSLALGSHTEAMAASDLDAAAQKLAGSSSHEWVLQGSSSFMGSSCAAGEEVHKFAANHTVSISRCVDGKTSSAQQDWRLDKDGDLDLIIVIGGAPYVLLFRDDETRHFMRLRKKSASKTDPTFDRDFKLSDD